MKMLAGGIMALALLGPAVAPAIAQPKASHARATQAKVFAEPG